MKLRRVVRFEVVPGTSISLGLVRKQFDLGDYVNPVCIPSITWVPLLEQCYITGRQASFEFLI